MSDSQGAPAGGGFPGFRRPGRTWRLVVQGARPVTPRMRRVLFAGEELPEMDWRPGQDLVLDLPGAPRRHYTIRALDRAARTLDIDFVLHPHGPAARWAQSVKPGAVIEAQGPRGRTTLADDADWHVFMGDETCIPAIFAMAEALPAGARAWALIEIEDAAERQPVKSAGALTLEFLVRDAPAGPSERMLRQLERFAFPEDGRGQFYVIGETSNVRRLRHHLLARGVAGARIKAEGYWRPGRVGGHDHV